MAFNREAFFKEAYPAVKSLHNKVHPSNESASFLYQRPATKNVPAFYDYFAPRLQRIHVEDEDHNNEWKDSINQWEDGIYTWVLLDTNDFFAIRTLTAQETGTLHENILKYIVYRYGNEFPEPKDQFVASGELYLKTDANSSQRSIVFNFESGTFLKLVLSGKTEKQQAALQNKLIPRVTSFLKKGCSTCTIESQLGKSFFSLFRIYTDPSLLSNMNAFLRRKPAVKNNSSLNKPIARLYVTKGGRKTKGRKTKGRKTKGLKTKKKKSLSLKKK